LVDDEVKDGLQFIEWVDLLCLLGLHLVAELLERLFVATLGSIWIFDVLDGLIFDGLDANLEKLEGSLVDGTVLVRLLQDHLLEHVVEDCLLKPKEFSEPVHVRLALAEQGDELLQEAVDVFVGILRRGREAQGHLQEFHPVLLDFWNDPLLAWWLTLVLLLGTFLLRALIRSWVALELLEVIHSSEVVAEYLGELVVEHLDGLLVRSVGQLGLQDAL
jgi:hypothetical protein